MDNQKLIELYTTLKDTIEKITEIEEPIIKKKVLQFFQKKSPEELTEIHIPKRAYIYVIGKAAVNLRYLSKMFNIDRIKVVPENIDLEWGYLKEYFQLIREVKMIEWFRRYLKYVEWKIAYLKGEDVEFKIEE